MLGIPKGTGNWFEQQWWTITHVTDANGWTVAFAAGTLVIILGFKRFLPKVPGAVVAVILLDHPVASALDASAHGVAVVGAGAGRLPADRAAGRGSPGATSPRSSGIAFSCFVLIIAQSAATSRSFAMKHGQRVDVNRDIVGLSGANFAAGLTGTFVVNGSPTKTQILDEQKGRTQLANITMSLVVLIVVLFLTGLLTDMPKAVLAAIVFLIGIDLIDIAGLAADLGSPAAASSCIAAVTAVVVFAVGVEQGIILAIVLSILEIDPPGVLAQATSWSASTATATPTYTAAEPGHAEPARSARVPLRRRAVLRQRQPVLRRRPGPDARPPRTGPLAGAGLLRRSPTSTTPPASPSPG